MVSLKIKERKGGEGFLNSNDASLLDAEIGDVIIIQHPRIKSKASVTIDIDDNVEAGTIELDRTIYESISLNVGRDANIERYEGALVPVEYVEFGLGPAPGTKSSKDLMVVANENQKEFRTFLGNRVFMKNSKLIWDKYGIEFTIKGTEREKLSKDDVARFGSIKEFAFLSTGSGPVSFDGILMIDVSGTMGTEDMLIPDLGWMMDDMGKEFTSSKSKKFLDSIKGKETITRFDAATLCALKYLIEKVARGSGDNISIILFSNNAEPIYFGKDIFYNESSTKQIFEAGDTIIRSVQDYTHNLTNMTDAFEKAIDVAKRLPKDKMKMFVLLTDGKPQGTDNEDSVLEIVRTRISPRKDVVVNTLGLGREVNDDFMAQIVEMTGGRYHHVSTFEELAKIYSKYAREFKIIGRK